MCNKIFTISTKEEYVALERFADEKGYEMTQILPEIDRFMAGKYTILQVYIDNDLDKILIGSEVGIHAPGAEITSAKDMLTPLKGKFFNYNLK